MPDTDEPIAEGGRLATESERRPHRMPVSRVLTCESRSISIEALARSREILAALLHKPLRGFGRDRDR